MGGVVFSQAVPVHARGPPQRHAQSRFVKQTAAVWGIATEAGQVAWLFQRGVAYVSSVTRTWRWAIDQLEGNPEQWQPRPEWQAELSRHAEGHQTTLGPYHRSWH